MNGVEMERKWKGYPVNDVQRLACWIPTTPFPGAHCEGCPWVCKCQEAENQRQAYIDQGKHLTGKGKRMVSKVRKKVEKEERKKQKIEKV